MGKVIGIGALVLGLWSAVEIYSNGSANAFDGALVRIGLVDEVADEAAPQNSRERVRSSANRAHADADERRERMLAD